MNLKQITQALVYDGETSLRGMVEKLTLEGRKSTEVEHKALGMVGILMLPGRPIQAIKGKIEIGHVDDEYERSLANPAKLQNWQLHQKVDVDADGYSNEKSHTIVHHVKFYVMEDDGVDMELGEKAKVEYSISVPFLKQTVLGVETPIFELDVFNDVYKVNGQNVWAA